MRLNSYFSLSIITFWKITLWDVSFFLKYDEGSTHLFLACKFYNFLEKKKGKKTPQTHFIIILTVLWKGIVTFFSSCINSRLSRLMRSYSEKEGGWADWATVLGWMTTVHRKEGTRWTYTSVEGPSVSVGKKCAVYYVKAKKGCTKVGHCTTILTPSVLVRAKRSKMVYMQMTMEGEHKG